MKGIIKSWHGQKDCGFIECDGEEYFLHLSEVKNSKKIKKGNIVEFDTIDNGENHLRAVNVHKTGHGTHHPFIQDLNRIKELVEQSNNPEKDYRLRDIQMMINYFSHIEDIEEYPDVRKTFRAKEYVDGKLEEKFTEIFG